MIYSRRAYSSHYHSRHTRYHRIPLDRGILVPRPRFGTHRGHRPNIQIVGPWNGDFRILSVTGQFLRRDVLRRRDLEPVNGVIERNAVFQVNHSGRRDQQEAIGSAEKRRVYLFVARRRQSLSDQGGVRGGSGPERLRLAFGYGFRRGMRPGNRLHPVKLRLTYRENDHGRHRLCSRRAKHHYEQRHYRRK